MEKQNITDEEIEVLESCKSAKEWDQACDLIKKARNGKYPPDWWPKVKLSGLMERVLNSFGETGEIKCIPLDINKFIKKG